MDRLICGICRESLDNEKGVCTLPCGHVKHIECLRMWSKEKKNCPNCWQQFRPTWAYQKRLYFDIEQYSENDTDGVHNENEQDGSILVTNGALKQQLEESKAEVDAAQTRINDLEDSIREWKRKRQNSEAQLRNLEHELSNSQAKNRDLEAKFAQTDVSHVISAVKKMENGDISRLQSEVSNLKNSIEVNNNEIDRLQDVLKAENNEIVRLKHSLEIKEIELGNERKLCGSQAERLKEKDAEVAKLSDEIAKLKRSLSNCQTRLADADKRNVDTNKENAMIIRDLIDIGKKLEKSKKRINDMKKEKEEIAKEFKSCEHLRQLLGGANEYADGINKKKAESKDEQSMQQQTKPSSVPIVPPAAWKRQNQESGAEGDSSKKSRIDTQKKSEEDSVKKSANVASSNKAVIT